jgi:NTP pyrophosphatase (non-canonical NTP hydrolase)
MNLAEYQERSKATINQSLTDEQQLSNFLMGLIGEFGELVDRIKKHHFQGHAIEPDKMIAEAGDVCWYCISTLTHFGIDANELPTIAVGNGNRIENLIFVAHAQIGSIIRHAADPNQELFRTSLACDTSVLFQLVATIIRNYAPDCTLEEILNLNVDKLARRYAGRFSTASSQQRTETLG